MPNYVRGLLNLRGVIVPIIDLRCRLGQGLTKATPLQVVNGSHSFHAHGYPRLYVDSARSAKLFDFCLFIEIMNITPRRPR